jgi:hypothetical protein
MATIGFKGGAKLQAILLKRAKQLGEGKLLRVGFLEGAKYPNGTSFAQVAFWNEYGTKNSPPRPFFRQMIASKSQKWGAALGMNLARNGYKQTAALASVGDLINDQLTTSIRDFSSPSNAESTIAKKGFDKPLLNTGSFNQIGHGYEVTDGES